MVKKNSRSRRTTSSSNSGVQHLRMINGDEIIGFVIGETKSHMTIDYPMVVVSVSDEKGSYIALQKYIPFSKEKMCNLQKAHIIAATELHPEIEKYYYLTLRLHNGSEHKMVNFIRQANHNMEQALINNAMSISQQLEDKAIHIVPGSDSKN